MSDEIVTEARFKLGRTTVTVEVNEDGQLELYANDGIFLIETNTANVIRLEIRRWWNLDTRLSIVKNIIQKGQRQKISPEATSREILDAVEGR